MPLIRSSSGITSKPTVNRVFTNVSLTKSTIQGFFSEYVTGSIAYCAKIALGKSSCTIQNANVGTKKCIGNITASSLRLEYCIVYAELMRVDEEIEVRNVVLFSYTNE